MTYYFHEKCQMLYSVHTERLTTSLKVVYEKCQMLYSVHTERLTTSLKVVYNP